jgi:hypothetical protein
MQGCGGLMRVLLLAVALIAAGLSLERGSAAASTVAPQAGMAAPARTQEIDDNDDTRVEVQATVLAIAVSTVFVLGTGAYVLRKKLGLVPPPPEQEGNSHH